MSPRYSADALDSDELPVECLSNLQCQPILSHAARRSQLRTIRPPGPISAPSSRQLHNHDDGLSMPRIIMNESILPWHLPLETNPAPLEENPLSYGLSHHYPPYEPDHNVFNLRGQDNNHNLSHSHSYLVEACASQHDASFPRSYPGLGGFHTTAAIADSYPPSAYQLEPQKPLEYPMIPLPRVDQTSPVYFGSNHRTSHESNPSRSISKKSEHYHAGGDVSIDQWNGIAPPSPAPAEAASALGDPRRTYSRMDDLGVDREEPYAKLIYRALMNAPGHTMVLRDLYEWFRQNTDKATNKDTKGWQNSIRHNLSMNGAFQKVDQPPGEEAKKGFMWRLTEKSIVEGVKSTTRYRSKLPNKRSGRQHNPAPQRQASGAKGGQAAKKAARLRRSERIRESRNSMINERFPALPTSVPRSVDTVFDPCTLPELSGSEFGSDTPFFYRPSSSSSAPAAASYSLFLDDNLSASSSAASSTTTVPNTPTSFFIDDTGSFPGTPNSNSDFVHLLDYGPNESMFYSSPDSAGGPATPPSIVELPMSSSDFLSTNLLI